MMVRVRYDTPDEFGETRRERNERFETPSPRLDIPEAGLYLWHWYSELAEGSARVIDGVCHPIGWADFTAWAMISGRIVRTEEFEVLRKLDTEFCKHTNTEFAEYRERERERNKKPNG